MERERFVIRVTDHTLTFALSQDGAQTIDHETYPVNAGMSLSTNLREAFKTSRLLTSAHNGVIVSLDSPVLLVPQDDFREEDAAQAYLYAYPETENAVCHHMELPMTGAVAIFAINKDLIVVLQDHYERVTIVPTMGKLWTELSRQDQHSDIKTLHAYFYENKMNLCMFHHRRFAFMNTFRVDSVQDAIYYILGVWQQLNAKSQTDHLVLLGAVPNAESTLAQLHKYINHVDVETPSELPLDLTLLLL